MKSFLAWIVTTLLAAFAASAEEPAAALARGKLESDLGHHTVAAEAFASVAQAPQATVPQRWEALVRLGVARRDAGRRSRQCRCLRGGLAHLREGRRGPSVPGVGRRAARFRGGSAGRRSGARSRSTWTGGSPNDRRVRVTWPGVPFGLCPCSGTPVDLDFQDGDLQDVFRLFADISGLNVVVQPGVQGKVTYRASHVPWDEALEHMLASNGLVARLEGNVLWIGHPGEAGEKRSFTGAPIDFEFEGKDLVLALREIAARAGASIEVAEGIRGHVTFKLVQVPWDQAFDLLTRVNGLTWTRKGDVLHVDLPRRASSR